MPTAAENLRTALDNACARLAELDTVPVDTRARMTYTHGVRTYGWNEYRAALMEEIKGMKDALIAITRAAGPYWVRSRQRG